MGTITLTFILGRLVNVLVLIIHVKHIIAANNQLPEVHNNVNQRSPSMMEGNVPNNVVVRRGFIVTPNLYNNPKLFF